MMCLGKPQLRAKFEIAGFIYYGNIRESVFKGQIRFKPMSKRTTVRPTVREISPVSIYGEVYGAKDLRKRCALSLQ